MARRNMAPADGVRLAYELQLAEVARLAAATADELDRLTSTLVEYLPADSDPGAVANLARCLRAATTALRELSEL